MSVSPSTPPGPLPGSTASSASPNTAPPNSASEAGGAAPAMPGVLKLHLDREKHLEVAWADGTTSVFPLGLLRSQCPCASCKKFREEQASRKTLLTLLPGNYSGPVRATSAAMVGNYALRIDWSDGHGSGIYSFDYLWGIRPPAAMPPSPERR
ncbi:MAG: DUF971 domain-containing protein [Tepidisphaerales bacterium]